MTIRPMYIAAACAAFLLASQTDARARADASLGRLVSLAASAQYCLNTLKPGSDASMEFIEAQNYLLSAAGAQARDSNPRRSVSYSDMYDAARSRAFIKSLPPDTELCGARHLEFLDAEVRASVQ